MALKSVLLPADGTVQGACGEASLCPRAAPALGFGAARSPGRRRRPVSDDRSPPRDPAGPNMPHPSTPLAPSRCALALGALALLVTTLAAPGCPKRAEPCACPDVAGSDSAWGFLQDCPGATSPDADVGPAPDVPADLGADGGALPPGVFGAPCAENGDCDSGWCVPSEAGHVCTRSCDADCPDEWSCTGVATSGSDMAFLCVPDQGRLCRPCTVDHQCLAGYCLTLGDGRACSRPSRMTR